MAPPEFEIPVGRLDRRTVLLGTAGICAALCAVAVLSFLTTGEGVARVQAPWVAAALLAGAAHVGTRRARRRQVLTIGRAGLRWSAPGRLPRSLSWRRVERVSLDPSGAVEVTASHPLPKLDDLRTGEGRYRLPVAPRTVLPLHSALSAFAGERYTPPETLSRVDPRARPRPATAAFLLLGLVWAAGMVAVVNGVADAEHTGYALGGAALWCLGFGLWILFAATGSRRAFERLRYTATVVGAVIIAFPFMLMYGLGNVPDPDDAAKSLLLVTAAGGPPLLAGALLALPSVRGWVTAGELIPPPGTDSHRP